MTCVLVYAGVSVHIGDGQFTDAVSAQAERRAARSVVGFVELPGIIGTADPSGPPGQVPPSKVRPITVRVAPNGKSLGVITDRRQLETIEHGYEESSVAVYDRAQREYEIGLRGMSQDTGWIDAAAAGTYRPVENLISEGLNFLTAAWDRHLYVRPDLNAERTLIPGPPAEVMSRIQDDTRRALSYWEAGAPAGAVLVEQRIVQGRRWFHVQIVQNLCVRERDVVASGWVPMFTRDGYLNLWFYSRGC